MHDRKLEDIGRPVFPPERGKRVPLNMRTTRELREKIEKAAERSGRSLVQEVEYRIEKSFWGRPPLEESVRLEKLRARKQELMLEELVRRVQTFEDEMAALRDLVTPLENR